MLEVMQVVVVPYVADEVLRLAELMDCEMGEDVSQVAHNEPGEECEGIVAHRQVEDQEEDGSDRESWDRGQKEPAFVFRVAVVHPVHEEMKALYRLTVVDPVK